jgi:DNA-binding GntR family transcriptional regulator
MARPPVATDTSLTTASVASVRVADHLRSAILRGDIEPGGRIRQEDVAERLGSSRLPVREALRILEAEGLIVSQANRGAWVPQLSMHEADVVYRMRERLDTLALVESLPCLSEADIEQLHRLQERIEDNQDVLEFMALDREFHLQSYSACPIEALLGSVRRLWNTTQFYRRAFVSLAGPQRMWIVNAEHRLILDAIDRRDPVDAERFLGGHIRRTRIELALHPEIFPASG